MRRKLNFFPFMSFFLCRRKTITFVNSYLTRIFNRSATGTDFFIFTGADIVRTRFKEFIRHRTHHLSFFEYLF